MTTIHPAQIRQVYSHDPAAARATAVAPSVQAAVRWRGGRLLLVRRCDSGQWDLPGGFVDIGENAVDAAVRTTLATGGVHVLVTGIAGLFTDPAHVVRCPDGAVRQQFTLLFRARSLGGEPHGDERETSEAAWIAVADLRLLPIEPSARRPIAEALALGEPPYLG
jgi:8-oxo-dGTP diphosphatase